MMKNVHRLLFFLYLAVATVLNVAPVQSEELVDVQSWADFQSVNLVSVSAVAEDCKKIFDVCKTDAQKVIDNLTQVLQNTDDATLGPPKVWDALTQITDILKNGSKQVRFHFSEIGDHFLKRLDGAIRIAKFKHSEKMRELHNIYNGDVDTSNELVISLNKYFGNNYNPNSNLQETVVQSLNQNTYSQSIAETELQQLSTIVKDEIDTLEKSAIELLNKIYKGITIAKEILSSLRSNGIYPEKWNEEYIRDNLQNSCLFSKAIASGNNEKDADTNDTAQSDGNLSDTNASEANTNDDNDLDDLTDVSLDATNDDNTGCAEIFRRTETKIAKQHLIAIKELKLMKDAKEIDSRTFKIFKNYSFILSNLNQKVITAIITFVNQFFQLYHIVLSILDKINPGMKEKAINILYMTDVDTNDANYENINKYIVEDYLSSTKMNELYQRISEHMKSMKSFAEIKKTIIQEISVTTNGIGQDMQTMKDTIFYIFEEIQKGVTALQNLKNKSNITGFRYYLNFYRGKADLKQLKKLIHIINSLNIELLLERQILSNEEELNKFKEATGKFQSEIDQEYRKLLNELNSIKDFTFARGFVSKSLLEYNMLLQSYCVISRKTIKKVITKYVTIFEEIIIIIKRRKIKNANTIEDLFHCDSTAVSNKQDEIISKYLLEKTSIDIEKFCKTLAEEHIMETKETTNREITELNTVTRSEVSKISKTVRSIITNMSSEIQKLTKIRETVCQSSEYEVTDEQLKCISNIIQTINSLQIKSNKDEIQGLSIYFERVQEKIQIAIQNFETETAQCNEVQQFKTQVQTLKSTIYEALTKASTEINEKISRVIFEYNEKLYDLKKDTTLTELNSIYSEENTFTLNDNTRKYITGCYTSEEIFKSIDDILNGETSDITQLKTDISTQLDGTNQAIGSELSSIHNDLNQFVQKFSEGMLVVKSIEAISQKQAEQREVIDQTQLEKLREVNDMVKVISKYVNINAESSEIELKVQIDNTRLRISQLCENVSQTLTSISDESQIESTISESINNCENIYMELKNCSMVEINKNINEFLESYQSTMTLLQSHESNDQLTLLQDQAYETKEDTKYEKFYQLMCRQDYQSSTTVTDAFSYLRRYNLVDSTNIKEMSSQVFQSLSYKMNMEIDDIKYVSEYMLESLQEANKALLKLENSAKQNTNITLNENELNELRKVKSISESWNYNLNDNTMSSIATSINSAKREIDIEYKRLKSKIESSSDESNIETEINTTLQNIENIYQNAQNSIKEKINLSVTNFHTSMSNDITELQSNGSETVYKTLQTLISGRNVNAIDRKENLSESIDFDSFTRSADVREIFEEIKTKSTNESSNSVTKIETDIAELRRVMYETMEKVEKTSTSIVENIQKGSTVMSEIHNMLSQKSDYQLTQYQEQQLKKCVSIYQKVGNLNINAKSAQERITNNISLIKTEINNEYTKVNDFVNTLSEEAAIEEAVKNSLNKFEQLHTQAKDIVKEQLSLISSNYYSSFSKTLTSVRKYNSNEITTILSGIKSGESSYQCSNEQSFTDTISYFNCNSFKSCLSIKNWYSDIHSTTSMENYSSINECSSTELSSLNDQIINSLNKMESSATYILQTIEKNIEVLKEIEHSLKQDITYQVTEEQISELQKCMSIYKSVQNVILSSASTSMVREVIENNINNIKTQISNTYTDITQSVASATTENSVEEIAIQGIKSFEQLFKEAKQTVKEELSHTLTSFYSLFTQICSDLQLEMNDKMSTTLQDIKSSTTTNQNENDQSFQDVVSYFSSNSFKSCISVKNWFNEIHSSTTSTSSTINNKIINELSEVNDHINNSFEKMESSSSYILDSVEQSIEVLKHIEFSISQGTTYQLTQEEIIVLKKSMSIHQSVQNIISTSSSTSTIQQIIESDIINTKEEINNSHSRVTQLVSSLSSESTINETATKSVQKYEKLFTNIKVSVIEQLNQSCSSFHNWYSQLSSDLQNQSTLSNLESESTKFENDQSFTSLLSCFESDTFKSSTIIHNWYKEIQSNTSQTEWSYFSERVVNEFDTLNERVIHTIDTLKESSTNILNIIRTGSEILKHLEESIIQESQQELSQEQITYLHKCMTIYHTVQSITTISSSTTFEAKQAITDEISDMKIQINDEFAKASQSISALSDESSIQQATTESVNHITEIYNETKDKVQAQLNQTFSNFLSNVEAISSKLNATQKSESSIILEKIISDKNVQQFESDKSYVNVLSYLKSDAFASSSAVESWYEEIQSSNCSNDSSNFNELAVNTLSTLTNRVMKSVSSLEDNAAYILEIIEKGTNTLEQVEQLCSKNSSYQLSHSQITELQKCVSIYTTIQSTVISDSSTIVSKAKKSIEADIKNVKNEINSEFNHISQSVSSLSDENKIEKATLESINKVDQYYAQIREKVRSQLTETFSTFYTNFQNITNTAEVYQNNEMASILKNLRNVEDSYEADSDQSFTNTLQYLNSDSFKSSSVIHSWYSDIHSNMLLNESSNVSENTIKEINVLNERVAKSIDTIEESSTNILNDMEKGSNILKKVENSISHNSSYQLNQDEVSYLQKCLIIYHVIQSNTTIANSTSQSDIKQVVSTEIANTKSQINDEFSKTSQTLSELKDVNDVEKVVNENVNKVNDYYGQVKEKIQSQLSEKTSNFFNSCQQISKEVDLQGNKEISCILQDMVNEKNYLNVSENDQSFTSVISYLKSDSFTSSREIKNLYQEIHSSISTDQSSSINKNAISELNILCDRTIQSVNAMESNSSYILDIIDEGSSVLKQIKESVEKNSSYQLTHTQIDILQKSITIYQCFESIKKINSSTEASLEIRKLSSNNSIHESLSNAEQVINNEVGSIKSQINDEFVKSSESIRALSDESSIKQAVDEDVSKVDQYYNTAKEKVHSKLSETSSEFFNSIQQASSISHNQSKSEISNVLQSIMSNKSTDLKENDQTFNSLISYLNSDSFKSNALVKNTFKDIQSNTSISQFTSMDECAVSELSILNNQVTKSVDSMIENSNYIISTFKRGSEIIKQVEESSKQGYSFQLSQDQIYELQKCVTIYNTIQFITNIRNSDSVSQNNVPSDQAYVNNTSNSENSSIIATNTGRSVDEYNSSNELNNISSKSSDMKNDIINEEEAGLTTISNSTNKSEFQDVDEVLSPIKIDEVQKKTTADISNIKTQIKDEYAKVSQSISSLKDEESIKKVVDENVCKVDKYYSQAKEKVQSQLTQTSSSFYRSCEHISERFGAQEKSKRNYILRELMSGENTYLENDESLTSIISYLQNDAFKPSSVQNMYQEIHSSTNSCNSMNMSENSIHELSTLNDRVTQSVDTMEERSKYIFDTMKEGSEILKKIEESSQQNSEYQLTEDQIIVLQKCISIYQTIQTITTTTTSISNTVIVSDDSITNQSTTYDDEYEYITNVTKNTKQIVQVEETSQEESEVFMVKSHTVSEQDVESSSSWNSAVEHSSATINGVNSSSSTLSDTSNVDKEFISSLPRTNKENSLLELEAEKGLDTVNVDLEKTEGKTECDNQETSDILKVDAEINSTAMELNLEKKSDVTKINTEKNSDITELNTETHSNALKFNEEKNNEEKKLITSSSSNFVEAREAESSTSTSQIHSTSESTNNKKKKDILAEFEIKSEKAASVSKESKLGTMKRTTHSSKMDLLKKYSQHQNTQSRVSISELMVNWKVTKSVSKEWPNTCKSLTWNNEKYFAEEEDRITIKEIAELLGVGRTVIEDSIELKKEKLPLYRDIDEIEMMVVSCIDVVDEILLQLSEVVGEDVENLRSRFSHSLDEILKSDSKGQSLNSSLNCKESTLDQQFLKTASTFFSMKDSKKTDLLNQINKEFGNVQPKDDDEARQIATQKFNKLQAVMKSVLDNIDCLSLRVIDTIMNAKNSLCNLNTKKSSLDDVTLTKYYTDIKNGQIFCDTVKIPST